MIESEKYKLSTYQNIETLNKTKESIVELVECTLDGKKYIKKTYTSDKRDIYRILLGIKNESVPEILDVFFNENTIIIEEYIEGKTLAQLIESGYVFSKKDIEKIVTCLTDAISILHQNNIIHRDIKPGNIIIKENGSAVLIDYGIARTYSPKRDSDTELYGTVGYAAPEQFGYSQSDYRTDIYAFGMTIKEIINKNNVSKQMYKAIMRCIEFDPSHRFQNMAEFKKFVSAGKKKKTFLIGLSALSFLILGVIILVIVLQDNTQNGIKYDELISEHTWYRIVDTYYSEEEIPCLYMEQDGEYNAQLEYGKSSKIKVNAKRDGKKLELTINGDSKFVFEDNCGLSTADYPEGNTTYSEIVFYDMNEDGIPDIIPVMCDGVKVNDMMLKNYSLAWCIYSTENGYVCADEMMTARLDPFNIYSAAPGCIWTDFPMYYRLNEGKLVLLQ